jgi:hypothetical protein
MSKPDIIIVAVFKYKSDINKVFDPYQQLDEFAL